QHNLRTSALWSVEVKGKGNDDVGNGMGKIGGVPDGGVLDRGGGNGSGEDKGNGGEGIQRSGDDSGM
nr:hypothetical protein [Tanacetum cinerariifolium]